MPWARCANPAWTYQDLDACIPGMGHQRGRFQLVGDRVQPAAEAASNSFTASRHCRTACPSSSWRPMPCPMGGTSWCPRRSPEPWRSSGPSSGWSQSRLGRPNRSPRRRPWSPPRPTRHPPAPRPRPVPPERRVRLTEEEFLESLAANCPPSAVDAARTLLAVADTNDATSVDWRATNAIVRLAVPRLGPTAPTNR